mmetsp:Transcript_9027/g.36913  ORF Transcript_9027/g.36913 Transcript_9027/m.36913 type:complete len:385 (+) Transcript_9027:188-1342(+)
MPPRRSHHHPSTRRACSNARGVCRDRRGRRDGARRRRGGTLRPRRHPPRGLRRGGHQGVAQAARRRGRRHGPPRHRHAGHDVRDPRRGAGDRPGGRRRRGHRPERPADDVLLRHGGRRDHAARGSLDADGRRRVHLRLRGAKQLGRTAGRARRGDLRRSPDDDGAGGDGTGRAGRGGVHRVQGRERHEQGVRGGFAPTEIVNLNTVRGVCVSPSTPALSSALSSATAAALVRPTSTLTATASERLGRGLERGRGRPVDVVSQPLRTLLERVALFRTLELVGSLEVGELAGDAEHAALLRGLRRLLLLLIATLGRLFVQVITDTLLILSEVVTGLGAGEFLSRDEVCVWSILGLLRRGRSVLLGVDVLALLRRLSWRWRGLGFLV